MTSETIQGSINCIGSGSSKKSEALKYLQLVNTDPTFRNMLAYGIEGTNWEYVDEDKDTIVKLNDEWGLASYTQGDVYKRQGRYGKQSPEPVKAFVSSLRSILDEE